MYAVDADTRCRVDFHKVPTKNCRINLSVLGECVFQFSCENILSMINFSLPVPPKNLSVFSEEGSVVSNSVIGPYTEGSSVNVTCMSTGGKYSSRIITNELANDKNTHTHAYVKHISKNISLTYNYIISILSFPLLLLWTDLHNVMTFEQLPSLSKNMFIRKFSNDTQEKKSNYIRDFFFSRLC